MVKIKPYAAPDFDAYLRLRNELDPYGQKMTPEDLRTEFSLPRRDPERDVVLVIDDGKAVGYARVSRSQEEDLNRHRLEVNLVPRLRGETALVDGLFAWCERRLREVSPEYGRRPLQLRTACYEEERWLAAAAERNGYEFVRYFARMDLANPFSTPAADSVAGAAIRPFAPERETAAVVAVLNRGFEGHFEHHPMSLANAERYLDTPWFQPRNVLVAEAAEGLAGVCWNYVDPEPRGDGFRWGIVQMLAVTPEWRGRGLGRALLRQGIRTLYGAGAERVCLWVDYANPFGAKDLYYGEGFVDRCISRTYAKDET